MDPSTYEDLNLKVCELIEMIKKYQIDSRHSSAKHTRSVDKQIGPQQFAEQVNNNRIIQIQILHFYIS